VKPRHLCSSLLHKLPIRPCGSKSAHVFQIAWRKTLHVRKGISKISRQPVHHLGDVALLCLLVQDALANVSIQQHHDAVAGQHQTQALAVDAASDLGQPSGLVCRHVTGLRCHRKHGAAVGPATLSAWGLIRNGLDRDGLLGFRCHKSPTLPCSCGLRHPTAVCQGC
jgi:hypothetical protein